MHLRAPMRGKMRARAGEGIQVVRSFRLDHFVASVGCGTSPEILTAKDMIDARRAEARLAQSERQCARSEERTVLVKEVLHRLMLENPRHAGRFDEYPCTRRGTEGPPYGGQKRSRVRHMFDRVT